ncbi:hypothetical protein KY345_00885 [Candidatus Woesearchaeota archaeon]|nr:hypothetical protein [Candidatus Woesearchaeota archaeon]
MIRKKDESRISYEIICKKERRGFDDAVYDCLADIKSDSFSIGLEEEGCKKVILGINKKNA